MDCEWTLSADAKLELVFVGPFTTESNADFVYVYDGNSSSARLTGRFSGSSRPGPSVSSSNQLHVRFTSNGSSQQYGFKATYRGMSSFLSWSCSRIKGFSARWDFFFTEVNPCWTRLITRWMTLQDCRPLALWRQAGVYAFVCLTNFQV